MRNHNVKMHTITELGTGVPAFLAKLWKLVHDPETDDLICWSPSGKSFFIRNQAQFARQLLPHYYKHNNMASFIRQLNMYGFHKKVSVELGGLKCDKDEMEFAHQYFSKDQPFLLELIKRKIASKHQDSAHSPIKSELMSKMLAEVRNMRGRQETLDNKLGAMKHENEALWRELALLRQKHMKQQQIVNKLIHFLVTLVQPSSRGGGLSVKRRYPLMIDDSDRSQKLNKLSKAQASPTGPVIHELDASEPDLDSEYIVAEMLENEHSPCIYSPQEHFEALTDDDNNTETIRLVDPLEEHIELVTAPHEIDAKKKRVSKGKKKRKNKVPVKILIPPLENGDVSREELHLLDMPMKQETLIALPNTSVGSKAIPMATMRSSKLAAMAANINKSSEAEQDVDVSSLDDDTDNNDAAGLANIADMLIPEMADNRNAQSDTNGTDRSDAEIKAISKVNGGKSMLIDDAQSNRISRSKHSGKRDAGRAGTSSTKDLSLSCINPGTSEANYRSESTEEMDTHLETMQTGLDGLRDFLQGYNCNIDPDVLLGLFNDGDDLSFELPINPELNPNYEREDNHANSDRLAGGELMAYNPTSSLLNFDDDILLNPSASLSTSAPDLSEGNLYDIDSSDPLDLEDSKSSLLDSLVTNNTNPKS